MTAQTGNKMENSREPKVGDVVHVRMTVSVTRPDLAWISATADHGGGYSIKAADIVHIEPAPLKVGDRVKLDTGTSLATIACIDNGDVWIRWDSLPGGPVYHSTFGPHRLTRISDGAAS